MLTQWHRLVIMQRLPRLTFSMQSSIALFLDLRAALIDQLWRDFVIFHQLLPYIQQFRLAFRRYVVAHVHRIFQAQNDNGQFP